MSEAFKAAIKAGYKFGSTMGRHFMAGYDAAERVAAPPESVICAAVQMADGYVIRGHRHHNCFETLGGYQRYAGWKVPQDSQGFITSGNRFVDRLEACRLFKLAGQRSAQTAQVLPDDVKVLFSEDLY